MKNIKSILKNIFLIYLVNLTFIGIIIFTIKIFDIKIIDILSKSQKKNIKFFNSQKNIFWANEISNGGYLLYFRHAERNKLPNLKAFDGLEFKKKYKAENTFFADRSCLNQNGKIEAKLIREYFALYNIHSSSVISSPSCRARQTAILAFDKIDQISNLFMYLSHSFKILKRIVKKKN